MKPKIFTTIIILTLAFSISLLSAPTNQAKLLIGFKQTPDPQLITDLGGKIKYVFQIIPTIAATIPESAIPQLQTNPQIQYIEEDAIACAIQELIPWGVAKTDPSLFFATGNMGEGVRVAILDTGIDYKHPDLAKNYKGGYDFINFDLTPKDMHGHGTHCAGIIAAEYNNFGVVGMAPKAHIYALKVLNKEGKGRYSDIIAGIEWSVYNQMQIISMSFGAYKNSIALKAACDAAYNHGLILVAAAGNDGKQQVMYPAKYQSVIAVSAIDDNANFAPWSNYGEEIEIAAPGTNIVSTYQGTFASFWGTSMACPHVTGVIALILSSKPGKYDFNHNYQWDPEEVRKCLHEAAIDLGPPGKDIFYGYGVVDAYAAALLPQNLPEVVITQLTDPTACYPGEPLLLTATIANKSQQPLQIAFTLTDDTYNMPLDTQIIDLPAQSSKNIDFSCPTDNAAPGDHTLKAQIISLSNQLNFPYDTKFTTITISPDLTTWLP